MNRLATLKIPENTVPAFKQYIALDLPASMTPTIYAIDLKRLRDKFHKETPSISKIVTTFSIEPLWNILSKTY